MTDLAFPFALWFTTLVSYSCERRPDETHQAFARFQLFLAIPAHKRTLAEVARVCGVSRQAIHLQAQRHDWAERLPVPNYLSFAAYGGRNPLLEALREREAQQKQELTD